MSTAELQRQHFRAREKLVCAGEDFVLTDLSGRKTHLD